MAMQLCKFSAVAIEGYKPQSERTRTLILLAMTGVPWVISHYLVNDGLSFPVRLQGPDPLAVQLAAICKAYPNCEISVMQMTLDQAKSVFRNWPEWPQITKHFTD